MTDSPAPSAAPTPTPATADTPGGQRAARALPGWLLPPLATAALLLALALRRRLARRLRERRFRNPDTNRAVIDAYRYLAQVARWGDPIPASAEALAQKARFSQHRLSEEERLRMVATARARAGYTDALLTLPRRCAYRYLWGLY